MLNNDNDDPAQQLPTPSEKKRGRSTPVNRNRIYCAIFLSLAGVSPHLFSTFLELIWIFSWQNWNWITIYFDLFWVISVVSSGSEFASSPAGRRWSDGRGRRRGFGGGRWRDRRSRWAFPAATEITRSEESGLWFLGLLGWLGQRRLGRLQHQFASSGGVR